MAEAELITHRLRQLVEDWCTNQSTLSGIDTLFGDADVPLTEGVVTSAGARRTRVRGYYASLDPASRQDFRRFLTVVATIMERIEEQLGPASPDAPDPLAGFQNTATHSTTHSAKKRYSRQSFFFSSGSKPSPRESTRT